MSDAAPTYVSYLLRMWRAGDDRAGAWRASLQNAQTGERAVFADLEALCAFLRGETHDEERADPAREP